MKEECEPEAKHRRWSSFRPSQEAATLLATSCAEGTETLLATSHEEGTATLLATSHTEITATLLATSHAEGAATSLLLRFHADEIVCHPSVRVLPISQNKTFEELLLEQVKQLPHVETVRKWICAGRN